MSDKSFGDSTNRNTVKNPLLLTAVTGLSIEDLTHNAVLLPAAPSQTLITRSDEQTGIQTHTLAHSGHEPPSFPSGDANLTILSSNIPTDTYSNVLDSNNTVKHEKTNDFASVTMLKASVKSEDDFDVNEYFARLQGTRYVSAPLHSHLKEDQNSNLQTEENLEEINLNEPDRVQEFQQSITADIAQNFSQLPTVLPQVASAVFSSFSNMLSYKSREQTPDSVNPGYQEVQLRPEDIAVPLMGVEDNTVKDVAPPPKELSVGGTVNYRITTKKKAYAQIPGLSSGETQNTFNQTFNQNVLTFFTPTVVNVPIGDVKRDEDVKSISQSYNIFNPVAETKAFETPSEIKPNVAVNKSYEANFRAPLAVRDHFAPKTQQEDNIQLFNVPKVSNASAFEEYLVPTLQQKTDIQLTNLQQPGPDTPKPPLQPANQFVNVSQGSNVPIIPPPPMFSNLPGRDSQPAIGKAILPPSIARRISGNNPIIKPQAMPAAFTDNIFVPSDIGTIPDTNDKQTGPIFDQATVPSFQSPPNMQSQTLPPSSFMPIQSSQHATEFAKSSHSSIFAPRNIDTTVFAPTPAAVSESIPTASIPPPSEVRPPTFPPIVLQTSKPSIFAPTNLTSEPLIFTPCTTDNNPAETPLSTVPMFSPESLPPISKPIFEQTATTLNINSTSSFITQNVSQSQSTTNLPPPPTFFNPNLMPSQNITGTINQTAHINQSIQNDIPQIPTPNVSSEPQKPLTEPPKASGSLNYRMTKKRPQYYAGPIEGVGSISNNVKPMIPSAETNTFQSALFTPREEIQPFKPNIIPHSVEAPAPFDLSKPVDTIPAYTPFDINKQQEFAPQPEFNTAFDFSRQTTETFEQTKQESKGFGILGSLKSKLSSIDMNKIQSTVTTFFDPAYNEPKTDVTVNPDNIPYGTHHHASYTQPINPTQSESTFEIFVPNLAQDQQSYSQIYDYETANNYPLENQYCNAQEQYSYYNLGQNVYPTATSSYYPQYSSTTGNYADIPVNADATSFSADSVTDTQGNVTEVGTSSKMEETSVEKVTQISSNDTTINTHSNVEVMSNTNVPLEASNNSTTGAQEIINSCPRNIDIKPNIQEDVVSTLAPGYIKSVPKVIEKVAVIQQTVKVNPTVTQDVSVKSFFDTISTENVPKSHIYTEDQSVSFNQDIAKPVIDMKSKVISKPFEEKEVLNLPKDFEIFNTTILPKETTIETSTTAITNFKFEVFPIKETNLIESLSVDVIPIVAVSSVPLFGLSTIIPSIPKEHTSLEHDIKNVPLFEVPNTSLFNQNTSVSFFENIPVETEPISDTGNISELNICETCREVNRPEDYEETDNLTAQLIENITSPIQLSNPVEVSLKESDTPMLDRTNFDSNQCAEIMHITEETIDTINVQSATELLDDKNDAKTLKSINYGWSTDETSYVPSQGLEMDHDYTFQINPETIGFFGNNSLFFENVPNNASDEIKAEFKNTHDDVLPRQISIPSAPPAEEDSKSDENGGLDVHSIEQDAKKDFPVDEFVIEPSETDDDKMVFREREKSTDDPVPDTFTNRVERFKKMEVIGGDSDDVFDTQNNYSLFDMPTSSPAISIASYFDTGNYAAETHYRNSISSPTALAGLNIGSPEVPLRIPPGFEEEFNRRMSELSTQDSKVMFDINTNIKYVPDTTTQTKYTYTPTVSSSFDTKPETVKEKESKLNKMVPETPAVYKTENICTQDSPQMVEFNNKIIYVTDTTTQAKYTYTPTISSSFETKQEIFKEKESSLNKMVPEAPAIFKTDNLCTQDSQQMVDLNNKIIYVPDTTTQTKSTYTPIDSSSFDTKPEIVEEKESNLNKMVPETQAIFKTDNLSTEDSQQMVDLNNKIIYVPDTTTQTKYTYTPSFSSSYDTKPEKVKETELKLNESVSEAPAIFKMDKLYGFSSVFGAETVMESEDTSDKPEIVKEIELKLNELVSETPPIFKIKKSDFSSTFGGTEKQTEDSSSSGVLKINTSEEIVKPTPLRDETFFKQNVPENQETIQSLPDPINFFSSNEPTTSGQESEDFSRLASYFSMPPSKPDHSKSFFELSQSQNHYRHETKNKLKAETSDNLHNKFNIPNETYIANLNLMKDLTSLQNFEVPKDQVVRPVNYFTVEYDMMTEFNIGEPVTCKNGVDEELAETELNDESLDALINKCVFCCNINNQINVFECIGGTNYTLKKVSDNTETGQNCERRMDPNKDSNKRSVSIDFGNYTLQEDNPEEVTMLNENRSASEYVSVKHHWFYRVDVEDKSIWRGFSVADSKALEVAFTSPDLNEETLVPTDGGRYDVNVKGRLRIPVYWIEKPTNVRRCSWFYKGTTDARYVPYREEVANILEEEYRHGITTGEWHRRLVLPDNELVVMHGPTVMVHFLHSGTTDAFGSPPQSTCRPRVVRRGCDESEIEDPEPSSIDHLLLLCHGVGSACDMRFRNVEEVVEDFRSTSLQLLQSHYRNSYDNGTVNRVEVLPISWHATLHSGETGVDRRLAQVTLDSIPRLRNFTNDTVLDVLFYTSPVFCQTILNTVCNELNRIYSIFKKRNPNFSGGVSLGGHSLGSVILYDLLCHQMPMEKRDCKCSEKNYVNGSAGTGQPFVKYPILAFSPAAMYALGSPIAIFECIRGVESLGTTFSLPTCRNFFNIFHPYDPIAYRIEPLINSQLRDVKPSLIPHHKGRKRMHLELKDTMARVGADLKQKLVESLRMTWNKWKAQPPPNDAQLEKVVEEEIEKESLTEDGKDEFGDTKLATPDMLGKLNDGRRVDYVLQEAPLEMINEYLFAMSSHVGYWESEDTMLLILREIYDSLGVQPDCTVPQQSMTVQRTRVAKQDEADIVGASDHPSTSRGGT